jgi:hypothetical protein
MVLVAWPLLANLRSGDHVIGHDAHVPQTSAKVAEQFEVLKPQNGGLVQGIIPPISFSTGILHGIPLALGATAAATQIVAMTLTFGVALLLAVTGFGALLAAEGREQGLARSLDAALLGALYVVAPFTLIYVSYGVFWSVNVALGIGALPHAFRLFLQCFVREREHYRLGSVAALSLCVIVVAWSILFIFPLALIATCLFLVRGGFSRRDAMKIGAMAALVLPGSACALYGMYVSVFDAGWQIAFDPVATNAGWELIKGGVLTGFLQHSAWPVYTHWTPRLLLGFPSHFFSPYYVVVTLFSIALVAAIPLMSRAGSPKSYLYAGTVLLVAVFFVKGGEEPFGSVYRTILSTVPGAGLIRTPDTKFGVFVILGVAAAFACALASRDPALSRFRWAWRLAVLAVVGYHAVPLTNGQAILGINSELAVGASERGYAVTLTSAERRIAGMLQGDSRSAVLLLPPIFATTRREGGIFAYRNVIGEFVPNPVYYAGWDEMPNEGIKRRLRVAVGEGVWSVLPEMGIAFVLVDHNAIVEEARNYELYHAVKNSPDAWTRAFAEGGYELFTLNDRFRKPIASIARGGLETPLAVTQPRGWFAFGHAVLDDRSVITLRSAENRHWRLVVLPRSCTLHVYLCAISAMARSADDFRVEKEPSPGEVVNRWSVERSRAKAAAEGEEMVAFVFFPQLLMYLLLVISAGGALLCAYLVWRARPEPGAMA